MINAKKTCCLIIIFSAATANTQNLQVSVSADTNNCFTSCTQITAEAIGGTPPYKYSWNSGETNSKTYTVCSKPPEIPPAEICGNKSILNGPKTKPAGAVQINPGQDLDSATQANPPGTTFWLSPGIHYLGNGIYDQVVPKNNNTYTGAPNAIIDGQNKNRYAFTQHAKNVTIKYLTIQHFNCPGNEGVVNHDSGDDWTIEYCTIRNNHGAGLMCGARQRVLYNCLSYNGQYAMNGFQAGDGIKDIVVDHNEIKGNVTDKFDENCGCTGGMKFWAVKGATVSNNWVHHNKGVGLWADTNDEGFLFEDNYINDNDDFGIFYEISYNAAIRNNTFERNCIVNGQKRQRQGDNFPVGAIYISESGGDSRVYNGVYADFEIENNNFINNWGGVVLWENADRFAGSPNNTSSDYYTLVNPKANPTTCKNPNKGGKIDEEPYYSDCRWKTQNVSIHNNMFHIDKNAIGCTGNYCGLNAVISNYGTSPNWSPYKGDTVQQNITFHQNNSWHHNHYFGDWKFNPFETGNIIGFAEWRNAPYNQDSGSTKKAAGFKEGNTYTVTVTDAKNVRVIKSITINKSAKNCAATKPATLNADDAATSKALISNASDVLVYPNPVTANFVLKISPQIVFNKAVLNMYDLSGKEIRSVNISNHQTLIERNNLKTGVYVYTVIINNKIIKRDKISFQ